MAPVQLYVYDMSKGMARLLSPQLLGTQVDGIWHTGVVVYGKEYFFGAGVKEVATKRGVVGDARISGVKYCAPGGTLLGNPQQTLSMGETEVTESGLNDFLAELATSTFRADTYSLFEHNCNHFSNELSQFLTGSGIPEHILNLPQDVLNTPFGNMIRNMLANVKVM